MTTKPQPPSDTDRVIAAQREESRRTRVLLVWLLVGVPMIGLVIWGCVALASAAAFHAANTLSNDDPCSKYDTAIQQQSTAVETFEDSTSLAPDQKTDLILECGNNPDESLSEAVSAVQSPNWTAP